MGSAIWKLLSKYFNDKIAVYVLSTEPSFNRLSEQRDMRARLRRPI